MSLEEDGMDHVLEMYIISVPTSPFTISSDAGLRASSGASIGKRTSSTILETEM